MSELVAAERMDALKPLMQRFARDNGFDNAGFACAEVATPASRHGRFVGILDLPQAWSRRYDSLSKMSSSSSDPVIRHVSKLSIPTTWDCEGRVAFTRPSIAKSARTLLGVAGEHGLRAGLTVPLCGRHVAWAYVVLTCRHTSDSRQLLASLADAALFAQGFMATVRRLTASSLDAPLSAMHREILRWCAIGKTSWEISLILGLSEATINFHLKNIARKLGVHGRTACVGHALANDLIAL